MNLQELNLVELNAQEIKETEGGFLHILGAIATVCAIGGAIYGIGYAAGSAYAHYENNGNKLFK
ncbi:class IIb bacteriocin, lactobin A/cerein 7B family [Flavobacterium sp.]|jgi:lactobin A/cerein 7B family class IIb bacteriocin|uniref:class IIb bacteriocin, lactobin A/cerein 7B family n=1 Tax=Flavobacterium sp. TaxID=239 RepID=UPI0037BE72DD